MYTEVAGMNALLDATRKINRKLERLCDIMEQQNDAIQELRKILELEEQIVAVKK